MNLYSYAGNNPIAFSDPYGLTSDTVKATDPNARETFEQIKQMAKDGAKSRDPKVAAAGKEVVEMIDYLEQSPAIITIESRVTTFFERLIGKYPDVTYESANPTIVLDPNFQSSRLFGPSTSRPMVGLHELGHAFD